jgi:hypothetical protein
MTGVKTTGVIIRQAFTYLVGQFVGLVNFQLQEASMSLLLNHFTDSQRTRVIAWFAQSIPVMNLWGFSFQ